MLAGRVQLTVGRLKVGQSVVALDRVIVPHDSSSRFLQGGEERM